jgi:predicted dehydrogenase
MTQRKLRCAVIGTGVFAEVCHIPGLQTHPDAEVVAVCGGAERAQRLADKFGIASVHTDANELCARDDIDAVTVVTRNAGHRTQALAAIRSGKHVLCEKPLGLDASEAREMTAAAIAGGRVHQVAFVFRHAYGVRELRRRVLRGDIGRPFLCRVQYDNWDGLRPDWKASWRDLREPAGAGVIFHLGSHLFDLARHVLGPIDSGIGFTGLIPRTRPDERTGEPVTVETDDLINAWLEHASGARGQIAVSRVTPSFTQNGWLEVVGPKGALKAALSRGTVDSLRVSTPEVPEWTDLPLRPEASDKQPHCLGLMMRSFVDACLRGRSDVDLDATFEDGAAAQYAMAAVLASETQRRWVRLDET